MPVGNEIERSFSVGASFALLGQGLILPLLGVFPDSPAGRVRCVCGKPETSRLVKPANGIDASKQPLLKQIVEVKTNGLFKDSVGYIADQQANAEDEVVGRVRSPAWASPQSCSLVWFGWMVLIWLPGNVAKRFHALHDSAGRGFVLPQNSDKLE